MIEVVSVKIFAKLPSTEKWKSPPKLSSHVGVMIKKKIKDKIPFIGYLLLTFSEKDTFYVSLWKIK